MLEYQDSPFSIEGRDILFSGACVISTSPSLQALVQHSSHMVSIGFHDVDVDAAPIDLGPDGFRERVVQLRRAFNADTAIRSLTGKLVREWGGDEADAYFDVLRLRIAPPDADELSFPLAPLPAHRDTWGSNLMQQVNVWAPIAPLNENATLAVWPELFDQPVINNSAVWDLDELRKNRDQGGSSSYPLLPTATGQHDITDARLAMPDVGEAFVFSGAHLHASVPNTSGTPRLNFEFRIVFNADRLRNAGAPNVDGAAPRVPLHWFKTLDGRTTLKDISSGPLLLA